MFWQARNATGSEIDNWVALETIFKSKSTVIFLYIFGDLEY